jgi:hypothetical protein
VQVEQFASVDVPVTITLAPPGYEIDATLQKPLDPTRVERVFA